MAKVVLCQPVYGHVPPAAHLSQVELVLYAGTHGNLAGICYARDTYLDWGRNHIVTMVAEQFPDFTHLFWLDADVIAPLHAMDALLEHSTDARLEHAGAIGGLYVKKGHPFEPVAYDFEERDPGKFVGTYERTRKLDLTVDTFYEVHGLGMGCTLVTRDCAIAVSEKTEGQSFRTTPDMGEDVWFFHWAHQLGFTTWLDTSVRCEHIGDYHFTVRDWESARDE